MAGIPIFSQVTGVTYVVPNHRRIRDLQERGFAMDGFWTVPGYRHVRALGEGASGTVFLAVHQASRAAVAIKYLSEPLRTDEVFLDRFRAEARLMADLDDPHVVRFYEYVEGPETAALVMELVDGVTLKEIISSEGATGPEAALLVLKGSLLGLAAAHAVGVVHRDYKPGNVLVREDGVSKLADFGIAVKTGDEVSASGTPAYMAPEQWRHGTVSAATDVYAATAVFYECLTGERPYPVKGVWALAAAHRVEPVPVDRVPEPLRGLVAHGLAKYPEERPASADAFLAELEAAALHGYGPGWEERGRVRLAALAALLAALFPMASELPTASTALALTRLGRRRLALAAGVVAGALVAGGGGAIALASVQHSVGPSPAATSTPTAVALPTPSAPVDSPDPSDSPSPSASDSTPPVTSEPTSGSTTPASNPTAAPSAPPTKKPPTKKPKPPTTVSGLSVSGLTYSGLTASATVSLTVSGPGSVTVTASFSSVDPPILEVAPGLLRIEGGNSQTVTAGSHSFTLSGDITSRCPISVTVSVTTSKGGSTGETIQGQCGTAGKANG